MPSVSEVFQVQPVRTYSTEIELVLNTWSTLANHRATNVLPASCLIRRRDRFKLVYLCGAYTARLSLVKSRNLLVHPNKSQSARSWVTYFCTQRKTRWLSRARNIMFLFDLIFLSICKSYTRRQRWGITTNISGITPTEIYNSGKGENVNYDQFRWGITCAMMDFNKCIVWMNYSQLIVIFYT